MGESEGRRRRAEREREVEGGGRKGEEGREREKEAGRKRERARGESKRGGGETQRVASPISFLGTDSTRLVRESRPEGAVSPDLPRSPADPSVPEGHGADQLLSGVDGLQDLVAEAPQGLVGHVDGRGSRVYTSGALEQQRPFGVSSTILVKALEVMQSTNKRTPKGSPVEEGPAAKEAGRVEGCLRHARPPPTLAHPSRCPGYRLGSLSPG